MEKLSFPERVKIAKTIGDKWAKKARENPESISIVSLFDIANEYTEEVAKASASVEEDTTK